MNHNDYNNDMIEQLKENSNWYLVLGIGLVILGFLAITYAVAATLFSVVWFGAFLISVGIFEIIKSFKLKKYKNFALHLILGSLYALSGLFIAFYPTVNALSLTLLLAIFFIISGILKIAFAIKNKPIHKGWLIFNGILTLLIGFLIWQQWPYSGLWAIGMLVGVDAIMTGWTWIILALRVKQLSQQKTS